jgi:hypothetical protein
MCGTSGTKNSYGELRRQLVKGQKLESAWSDENWPFTAEQDLLVFLNIARIAFAADPTNPLPAFEALVL